MACMLRSSAFIGTLKKIEPAREEACDGVRANDNTFYKSDKIMTSKKKQSSIIARKVSKLPDKKLAKRPEATDGFALRHNRSIPLWERILAWCNHAQWYASDYPQQSNNFYCINGSLIEKQGLRDPQTGFEFPTVTEEQLLETERLMGFSHPPFLRTLYLKVANGGFGPYYGLIGLPGGCCFDLQTDPRYKRIVDEYTLKRFGPAFIDDKQKTLIDLEQREHYSANPCLLFLERNEWPEYFLNLCGSDEDEGFFIHAPTNHVYLCGNAWFPETTIHGERAFSFLHRQTDSLEEWFENWLAGTFSPVYQHPKMQISPWTDPPGSFQRSYHHLK